MIWLAMAVAMAQAVSLPSWDFDSADDLKIWQPNTHLSAVQVEDGVLSATAVDWDPFFSCRSIEIPANPWQMVLFRVRADRPGTCSLFWSGSLEGENGGLTEKNRADFTLDGNGEWEIRAVFPFWHAEEVIRQLRFDVYNATRFDVDWIRVAEWGQGEEPDTTTTRWVFDENNPDAWVIVPGAAERFSPPLRLDADSAGWAAVELSSDTASVASLLWAAEGVRGLQSQDFPIEPSESRVYNVELQGNPAWSGNIVSLGVRLPEEGNVRIMSVSLAGEPQGPPRLEVTHLGFENAPNRAGNPCRILARISNQGGGRGGVQSVTLEVPPGVTILEQPESRAIADIAYNDYHDLHYTLHTDAPGTYPVRLVCEGKDAPEPAASRIVFTAPLGLPKAGYVPPPTPVETDFDLCMYYFPGWYDDTRWECIRNVAPIRKPVLGYYDERNPECVDWQIKWARENGINCFLVDWYWSEGNQSLTHWFEGYRKARYRDMLEVAIMWANHNAPGTHSAGDWRAVTQEWIGHYFNLPSYYHIDGKPAVFIWAPGNVRRDLGGVEAVKKSLQESQDMAKAAGYDGITFVAMGNDFSSSHLEACHEEGYAGVTTYHEWGSATDIGSIPLRRRFEDVANTVGEAWAEKDAASGPLTYYPVLDTGWDSRPWHGDSALVIEGRTADLWEQILRSGKDYAEQTGRRTLIFGPANEWGEGSYVEPNREFGFDMYERVRAVFGKDAPSTWPVNVAPTDIGLGPYDFPATPAITSWGFDEGAEGWSPMMGIADFQAGDGALRFRTASHDPALMVNLRGLRAADHPAVEVRMLIQGGPGDLHGGQLFWSTGGAATSENTSVRFPIQADGAMHTYTIDLTANPRWRGRIASLRFDPCNTKDVEIIIDSFTLIKVER